MAPRVRARGARVFGALTADLVWSRRMTERAAAQERLNGLVRALNRSFARRLAAPFMVTLGDEIQGLFGDLAALPAAVISIHGAFHPREITVAIGVGGVATSLVRRVTQMDGDAFVRSRQALERGKREERQVIVASRRPDVDEVVNAIYALIGGIQTLWSETQWRRVALYRELGTIEEVARRLGVARQSVSKSLRNTLWLRVLEAERTLPALLSSLGEGGG